jgi:O-antigen ligase
VAPRPAAPDLSSTDQPRRVWGLELPQRPAAVDARAVAQDLAVLVAFVIAARIVTGRTGGRGDGALLLGCASLIPALLLLPARWRAYLPALVLSGAALGVCLLSPFGWSGASVVATAAYAACAFAVVRAYVATTGRSQVVASAVCLASLDQFAQGFLAWWGGGDPTAPMIGTFFWHNQYATYLLPGLLIGTAQALAATRIHRLVGWVTAPVCLAGVVLSTSRASMLLAGVGVAVVVLLVLAGPSSSRRTPRVAAALGLGALCAAVTLVLTSPVFFQGAASSPGAATAARAANESVSQNTGYRLQFWEAAIGQAADRPLLGGGFGSFRELSVTHLPPGAVRPSSAHNELLNAFAEGGLLWGLPVALAIGFALLAAVGLLLRQLRRPDADRAVSVGAAVALGAVVAHALVDFDWSYPALVVTTGVLTGLVLALWRPPDPSPERPTWRGLVPAMVVAALLLGAGQLAVLQERTTSAIAQGQELTLKGSSAQDVLALLEDEAWSADPRTALAVLEAGVPDDSLRLGRDVLERAVRRTERLATASDSANAQRAAVIFALGRQEEALRLAREMARERAHSRPATLQSYAHLLALSGRRDEAVALLAGTVLKRTPELQASPGLEGQLVVLYKELSALAPGSLEQRCAGDALAVAGAEPPPDSWFATLGASDVAGSCQQFLRAGWS